MSNKDIVRDLFINLFENKNFDLQEIENLVAKEYIQHVDGKLLGYTDFVKHIEVLRSKIETCKVEFKTLVCEDDVVFSNHTVDIKLIDGHKAKTQVIAEFHFREGKLCYCDELTRLIDGNKEHSNLGSIS